jgi:hypothetical protein
VVVESGLESCLAYPDIFFGEIVGGNSGFVYDSTDLAISTPWTLVGFSAVACLCGCWCFVDNGFVVCVYDPVHVVHAAVAYFDIVTVENLLEDVFFWKVGRKFPHLIDKHFPAPSFFWKVGRRFPRLIDKHFPAPSFQALGFQRFCRPSNISPKKSFLSLFCHYKWGKIHKMT